MNSNDTTATLGAQATILCLETSRRGCSVALVTEEAVLWERNNDDDSISNAALVGGYCQEAIRVARERQAMPVAIALTGGPGSYTGLRIGAAIAKGLAFGGQLPLIAVSTTEAMAMQFVMQRQSLDHQTETVLAVLQEASREDVYVQLVTPQGDPLSTPQAVVPNEAWVQQLKQDYPKQHIIFVGDAVNLLPLSEQRESVAIQRLEARSLRLIAWRKYRAGLVEDVAYWHPNYVKPYKATISKNKVLNR